MIGLLDQLLQTDTGRDLIGQLLFCAHPTTLVPSLDYGKGFQTFPLGLAALRQPNGQSAGGAGSLITIPISHLQNTERSVILNIGSPPESPPLTVILGHELIHAVHNSQGENDYFFPPNSVVSGSPNREEERTCCEYTSPENQLRAELNLPMRMVYPGRIDRVTP